MKLLTLSFWTPPQLRPQAILIGKMIPEWVRQGMEPVVLSYEMCGQWDVNVPVVTIPGFQRGRLAKFSRLLGQVAEARYYDALVQIAAQTIKTHEIRLIFSFANPMESNLLGVLLKQRLGVRFVAHFSDPYADSPLKESSPRQIRQMLAREKEVIEVSDRVVFVNDALRELVMRKYPPSWRAKSVVIPHCYDSALYPVATGSSNVSFTMSHVGAFYPGRQPEKFFAALSLLKQKRPEFEQAFKLQLIGGVNPYSGYSQAHLDGLIKGYGLEKMVVVLPMVDYATSLAWMVKSDSLLALDADLADSPFLPSKLIDYIGADRPIIAITPDKSPTWQVVTSLGGASFTHAETEKMADHLEKMVFHGLSAPRDQAYAQQFDVVQTTVLFRQLFEQTLAGSGVS